jgi:hypothetical protein
MVAPKPIVIRRVAISPPIATATASSAERLSTSIMIELATRPESANTSPCAKLISCRMP